VNEIIADLLYEIHLLFKQTLKINRNIEKIIPY
jgi:hypothetical protein